MKQVLTSFLKQNKNDQQLKQIITIQTLIRQKLAFHYFTSSNQTYLQAYGICFHDQDKFNYIGQLLHHRSTAVLGKIKRQQINVNQIVSKLRVQKQQMQQQQLTEQMKAQVQDVLNNVDLPLSLFKRNDRYWSHDNPKTVQARQYIKKMQQQQKKFRFQAMKKSQKIRSQKDSIINQSLDQNKIQQEQRKKQFKQQMKRKIQDIKTNAENRKKKIDQSIQVQKSLKPFFKTIEKRYHDNFQAPSLQQRKKKLSQIRQLRRSVDLIQIQEHKKKLDKLKAEHQDVKIINDPMKIQFKSKFHKQLAGQLSTIDFSQSRIKSLYEKKLQYGKQVKQKRKPKIDQKLVSQIEQRVKILKKKRVRVYKKKDQQPKETGDSDQQDQEQQQQQSQVQEQPQQQQQVDDQDQDEDQSPKVQPQKDDQYDPDRKQRYKLGVGYLQQMRKMIKKREDHKKIQNSQQNQQQQQKQKTFTIKKQENLNTNTLNQSNIKKHSRTISADKQKQKSVNIQFTDKQIDKDTQINNSLQKQHKQNRYKDYLKQMSKTSKTSDYKSLDTDSLTRQLQKTDALKNNQAYSTTVQRKMRKIYQKAVYQQQLLKYQNNTADQKMKKKHQVDNAVIATIKARLALMGNK